jgi:hypothetical protein
MGPIVGRARTPFLTRVNGPVRRVPGGAQPYPQEIHRISPAIHYLFRFFGAAAPYLVLFLLTFPMP